MLGAAINVVPIMLQRNVPGIGGYVIPAYMFAAVPAVFAALAYASLASAIGGHHTPEDNLYDCPLPVALVANLSDTEASLEVFRHDLDRYLPAEKIEGILESLNVRVGDRVQAGEQLATLDTRSLSHQLAIEQANLKSAEAERKKQSIEVERAAQEEQRRLALSGLVSREEGEAAAFRASSAKASLEAAEARANQVQARIDEISDILSRSVLRAPFTGLISRRYLDPGSRTGVGTPVVRLVRLDDLMVRFAVPLDVAEELSPGDPVRAELVNERSAWAGVVEQIAPEIDPAALLVFVEARLETPDRASEAGDGSDSLVFGTEARVSLMTDPGQNPTRCLSTEP